jgi:RNA-directed DNA polymerase
MQEQLEFQFNRKPDPNEGVKPRDRGGVVEYGPAETEGDLTNGDNMSLLESILSPFNLDEAMAKVRSNGGAPGVDGITVKELEGHLSTHWSRIEEEIRTGTYKPLPVRRVEIPKPNGGKRMLGIPSVTDRVIQQAILQRFTPIFDPEFSESSYGFRPNRSAHDAVRQARKFMEDGYYIVVDIDLEKFFDRVNHDMLMARVARKVKDKTVLKLIRAYLNSGMMCDGVCVRTEEGVPQGGPLSPLLANILLDDLDKELERRGHRFCRYADDCNIYVKGKRSGERVKESVTRFLREKLKLKVNEEKSAVDRPSNRKFLGFSFYQTRERTGIRIFPGSIKRLKDRIRHFTKAHNGISLEERLKSLNRYLRGWIGYYALADAISVLKKIAKWLRRRMRLIVWYVWKNPKGRYRNLRRLGLSHGLAMQGAHNSNKGWRNSQHPAYHTALCLNYWNKIGLVDLPSLYYIIRQSW